MDDEVLKFWQEFEEDTGERVQAKAVGELCDEGGERGVWFLLILTNKAFWFKQVPSDNWIASLFKPKALSASSRREKDLTVVIPRGDLVSLVEPGRGTRGWFSRPIFPRLVLSWREGEDLRTRSFSVDPSTDLLARLRELFKGKPA